MLTVDNDGNRISLAPSSKSRAENINTKEFSKQLRNTITRFMMKPKGAVHLRIDATKRQPLKTEIAGMQGDLHLKLRCVESRHKTKLEGDKCKEFAKENEPFPLQSADIRRIPSGEFYAVNIETAKLNTVPIESPTIPTPQPSTAEDARSMQSSEDEHAIRERGYVSDKTGDDISPLNTAPMTSHVSIRSANNPPGSPQSTQKQRKHDKL